MEILIYEFEKSASDEAYDRSIFIDISYYRGVIVQWHSALVVVFAVISLLIFGSHDVRSILAKLMDSGILK